MSGLLMETWNIETLANRQRTVRILLPAGYETDPDRRYPVLYMHDGQNLFDPSLWSGYSWDVARSLDRMQADGAISGIIVVGIDSGSDTRIGEYSSAISAHVMPRLLKLSGNRLIVPEGEAYARFLIETLKPSIDARFRTLPNREHTGTCGSSCGGNIALYLGTSHGDVFGVVGAFSPALWIIAADIFARIDGADFHSSRIYHDMGGREGTTWLASFLLARRAWRLQRALRSKGLDADRLHFVFDRSGHHTELFWQDRFPGFIRWAFGKKMV